MSASQVRFRKVPKSYVQLEAQARASDPNAPEFVSWCYYDTVGTGTTIVAAYSFFSTAQSDVTLGNLQQPNTVPSEEYFELHGIFLEPLVPITAASEVNVNNLITFYYVARPVLQVNYANKLYGQFPISHLTRPGGFSVTSAIVTHSEAFWNSDGAGVWIDGALLFQPRQTFTFVVTAVAGGSITTASLLMRMSLYGTKYRRVL